jgi:DNA-directed RNA polymerase specialized sigma24 family protein
MYAEHLVESLIPAIWEPSYAWGIPNEYAADADMPKVKYKSPKETTTFWTHIIDIRRAWDICDLTDGERRALLLTYGFGWDQTEIARHEQVSQRAISKRLKAGLECLVGFLNKKD